MKTLFKLAAAGGVLLSIFVWKGLRDAKNRSDKNCSSACLPPRIAQASLENPYPEVRELAMSHLREFAAAGDPFSLAILEGREIP
jgi:hypothetical protein